MSESNYLQKYSTFSDVENPRVRAYNRIVTYYQIAQDHSLSLGQQYIASFDRISKTELNSVFNDIKLRGLPKIRREISGSVS